MAATNPSVKVVKSFPFKGGSRLWSNRYHFNGSAPSSDANWHLLFDAIVAAEKLIYDSVVTITECLGYINPSDVAVSTKVYSQAGTLVPAGGSYAMPGESAALARWSTAARSTKNHPIFAFSYFHGAIGNTGSATSETLLPGQRTAMQTYAALWVSGITAGGVTAIRATPAGHAVTGSIVDEYVTHRDFPYTPSL